MIKAFPFDKMIPGMLDAEMIEDTAKNDSGEEKGTVFLCNTGGRGIRLQPDGRNLQQAYFEDFRF